MKSSSALTTLLMFRSIHRVVGWVAPATRTHQRTDQLRITTRLLSRTLEVDEEGRTIRKRGRRPSPSQWDDFVPVESGRDSGWDDFDVDKSFDEGASSPKRSRGGGGKRPPSRRPGGGNSKNRRGQKQAESKQKGAETRKINMKALEGAGFVHLYGLASVLNALHANKRDFTRPEDVVDLDLLDPESYEHEMMQRERKPEAQFSPWLFVQEKTGVKGGRSHDKAMAADDVARLAEERGIPIAYVDKGVLNTLCGNRPHQGYVLRCGKLTFDSLPQLPNPKDDPYAPNLWLALDEVVDPQNLGALLRSAYFIGGDSIGVLVCAKNSAPPSPVVSAASAGALELIDVQSTSNLPRTLNAARESGFRVIGASSSAFPSTDAVVHDLSDLPSDDRPTILVLGSEGHGLRNLVAKACSDFVRIPGQESSDDGDSSAGVDSLNVSVTGGILLWHLKSLSR